MTELLIRDLVVEAAGTPLVREATLRLRPGELVALLGPNGAGKTSLVRGALGLHRPRSGTACLDGTSTLDLSPADRARRVAYLPQQRPLAWPSRVRDVIALGRFAHGARLGRLGASDAQAVDRALRDCGLETLAERSCDTLSGGELARVHCARAFAAATPLLIADEPIAALDPHHQFRILDLFKAYVAQGGGALLILHDVALAARYATRLVWMKAGRLVADGPVEETLSVARLAEVYGIRAQVSGRTVTLDNAL